MSLQNQGEGEGEVGSQLAPPPQEHLRLAVKSFSS